MSACGHFSFTPAQLATGRLGLGIAAQAYIRMGYAVLPLARGGKRPHRMLGQYGGVHHATTGEDAVDDWWTTDPAANIGVACGSKSRLMVIDLDVKHGTDGWSQFWTFALNNGLPVPRPSVIARTPSGGSHIWLRSAAGQQVPDRPGILPGVDVKGDGGYVVAPPSMLLTQPLVRPGERGGGEVPVPYEWTGGSCPHAAPWMQPWMGEWLAHAPAAGTAQGHGQADGEGTGPDLTASGGLERGYRNRGIYRMACSLYRRYGTGPAGSQIVLDRLREVWDKTDHTDFGWDEVLRCADSARRFIQRQQELEDSRNASFLAWLARGQGRV